MSEFEVLTRRQSSLMPKRRGIEARVLTALLLILVAGITASFTLRSWDYFARSGAAVVVLGIVMTWKDFSGQIDQFADIADKKVLFEYEKLRSEIPSSYGLLNTLTIDIERKMDETRSQLRPLFIALRFRMRALEAGILVLGTMISGFGDMLDRIWPLVR